MAKKIPVAGTKPKIWKVEAKGVILSGVCDQSWRQRVTEIVFPIQFDEGGTHIFDADGKMIAQVRGWGGLTSSGLTPEQAAEQQTEWGRFIAAAINEYARACGLLNQSEEEADA